MPYNAFTAAMNAGNAAFGVTNAESFQVEKSGRGGDYTAISIDDLASSTAVVPGGNNANNNTLIFITKAVLFRSEVIIGSVLSTRGKRFRIESIDDDGTDTVQLTCSTAGIKL